MGGNLQLCLVVIHQVGIYVCLLDVSFVFHLVFLFIFQFCSHSVHLPAGNIDSTHFLYPFHPPQLPIYLAITGPSLWDCAHKKNRPKTHMIVELIKIIISSPAWSHRARFLLFHVCLPPNFARPIILASLILTFERSANIISLDTKN